MENNANTLGRLPGAALGPLAHGPWAAPGRDPWVWHFSHDPSGRDGILSHKATRPSRAIKVIRPPMGCLMGLRCPPYGPKMPGREVPEKVLIDSENFVPYFLFTLHFMQF